MTALAPLVLGADGLPQQLQAGDTVGAIVGVVTVTVPRTNGGAWEWEETVAAVGVTPGMTVGLFLAATTDADENDPEFLSVVSMRGNAGTDQVTVNLAFGEQTSGPILIRWSAQ